MALKLHIFSIILYLLLLKQVQTQTIPESSYTRLVDYNSNSYFQAINKKMIESYPSYLTQSTVVEVYMYSSTSLISFIITYSTRSSSIFRGTVDYTPASKQMNIRSFGPVAQRIVTTTPAISNRTNTDNSDQSGIGILKTSVAPNRQTTNLVASSNPSVVNSGQSRSSSSSNSNRNSSSSSSNSSSRNNLRVGQTSAGGILIRRS